MGKIFKHLWIEKKTLLAVILLLIVQAFCDLMLPNYTSDIVDVGIMQKGIAYITPDAMTEECYADFFSQLLTQVDVAKEGISEDYRLLESCYDYDKKAQIYRINSFGKKKENARLLRRPKESSIPMC